MSDPHAAAPHENPEDHIGEEIPDPWDDREQSDWISGPIGTVNPPPEAGPRPELVSRQEGDYHLPRDHRMINPAYQHPLYPRWDGR